MDHPFYLVGRGRRWVIVYINANSYLLAQVGEVHGKGGVVSGYWAQQLKPFNAQNDVGTTDG